MQLSVRFFLLKCCQHNWRHGKFISLVTAVLQRESPPLHFQRFFASNSSTTIDQNNFDSETKNKEAADKKLSEWAWHCSNCNYLNWPHQRFCKNCTIGAPTEEQKAQLQQVLWLCPRCTARTIGDHCLHCGLDRCTVHEGKWVCLECMWRNISSHSFCRKCIRGRPTEEQCQLIKSQRWVCGKCKHHNFTEECVMCRSPKSEKLPDGVGGESLPDGSWYCVNCIFLNFPNYLACRKCRKDPTAEQLSVIHSSRWSCAECTYDNYEMNLTCYHCNAPRPTGEQIPPKSSHWICSICFWRNKPVHLSCQKCTKGRPTEEERELIKSQRWVCGICRHHNFSTECFKCGAPKSKGFSGGVGGEMLSDGSWYCISCWFLNFPNFLVCRQCYEGVPTDEQFNARETTHWECVDCGAHNFLPEQKCYKCHDLPPVALEFPDK